MKQMEKLSKKDNKNRSGKIDIKIIFALIGLGLFFIFGFVLFFILQKIR